jgi:intracellular multiplication protein IcmC
MVSNKLFSKLSSALPKALAATILLFTSFYAQLAFAAPDVAQMLENLTASIPNFMRLITASAYVIGMYLIFKGVIGLRQFGESRSMMSASHELKGPLILLAVGTALLYLPSSVQAGLNTFWSNPNPYGYIAETTDQWGTLIQDCFMVIQLIGTVAFIRGLLILTQLSGQGGQPGTLSKGITHIVGGALCINLYDFLNAVYATLGIGTS